MASGSSDHLPVLIRCVPEIYVPAPRQLQYEIFWESEPTLGDKVKIAWEKFGPKADLGSISKCLKGTMRELHKWSRVRFGNVVK